MDDALSVSAPPVQPARRRLLSQAEYAAQARYTTERELQRLKTTAEYLDRRDEFQQREAALEAAAARHSWLRYMYLSAQVAGVFVLLCACLCMSVVFVANSYPETMGMPGPESSSNDFAMNSNNHNGGKEGAVLAEADPYLDSQQDDRSTSSVSDTIPRLGAHIQDSDAVSPVAWPSQPALLCVDAQAASNVHIDEQSAEAASSELTPRVDGSLSHSDILAGGGVATVASIHPEFPTSSSVGPVHSEDQVHNPAHTGAINTGTEARLSIQHHHGVSEHPPALARPVSDAGLLELSEESFDSQVQTFYDKDEPDPYPQTGSTSSDTAAVSGEQWASAEEQNVRYNVFGPLSMCPPEAGAADGKNSPGELAMYLGVGVFWAPVAFQLFCMWASAASAAGTAAAAAAGSPPVAAAYLLLVVTMAAIAFMLLPAGGHQGVQGRVPSATTPLGTPRGMSFRARGLSRRSPSFQRLLEEPESAEAVIHGAIAHTPSTVEPTGSSPSPWLREAAALQQHVSKLQHQEEDHKAAITQSMELLMRMRSQAQGTAVPFSPGDGSGSDTENVPEENSAVMFTMEESDTVCCGDGSSECDTAPADGPLTLAPTAEVGELAEHQNDSALAPDAATLHDSEHALGVSAPGLEPSGSEAADVKEAVVALSAGTDGVSVQGRVLADHLTKLDEAVQRRKGASRATGATASQFGRQPAPAVVPEAATALSPESSVRETEAAIDLVEEVVGQVHSVVDSGRGLAKFVYGPDVKVEINGRNWHTEVRNIMKLATLKIQQQHPSDGPLFSPVASPAGSGAPSCTPNSCSEGAGSTRGPVSPVQLAAESGQNKVAGLVERMLAGEVQEDLAAAVSGLSEPSAKAIYQLHNRLFAVSAPQVKSTVQRACPTPLAMPYSQQCAAATPFPTPASAAPHSFSDSATAAQGLNNGVSPQALLARCQEFSSGLGAAGCVEAVEVTLEVASSGLVALHLTVCAASQSSAHLQRLFRSLSVGLNGQEAQHAQHVGQQQAERAAHSLSPLSTSLQDPPRSLAAAAATPVSTNDASVSAFAETQPALFGHATSPAGELPASITTAPSGQRAHSELEDGNMETWSMPTPTPLSGRDTDVTQSLASNDSELYERGFQLEQSIQDIDDRGCFRAGQDAEVAGRPLTAAEGVAELQRILVNAAADSAAQDAFAAAVRNWEDISLTKRECHTLKRYLTQTMADIMARVPTPSPSVASSHSQSTAGADDVDAENSGSGQRDKFLSYRYQVGTVNQTLGYVEHQDIRFRQLLSESVSLQEQLAVACKGLMHLQSSLSCRGATTNSEGDEGRLGGRHVAGSASRDALLSRLVTWDPTAPEAPEHSPADMLRQFRAVDRPLAPLAAQMDAAADPVSEGRLLLIKEQLEQFITSMSSQSAALSAELASAGVTMQETLAAVYEHALQLLRFFADHSYSPPQAVSAVLNKAAAHSSTQDLSGPSVAASGSVMSQLMLGADAPTDPAMWMENYGRAPRTLSSDSSTPSPGSGGSRQLSAAYAHCSTQGILTESNTSPPASACSPAWAGLPQANTRPQAVGPRSSAAADMSPLRSSAAGMQSPSTVSPVQFPPRSLADAPTPSLSFALGSQDRSTERRSTLRENGSGGARAMKLNSAGPPTEFATPDGHDPLTQAHMFLQLPEDSAEDAAESPRGPSPTLSPLLLSAVQQQHEQFRGTGNWRSPGTIHNPSVGLGAGQPKATVSGSVGASGPTSNGSSLSFAQATADTLGQSSAPPASISPPLQAIPYAAAAIHNIAVKTAPAAQWPLDACGPSSVPQGSSGAESEGGGNNRYTASPFHAPPSSLPCRSVGDFSSAQPRTSCPATGDGGNLAASRLPRRPSHTGSGALASRASSMDASRDEQQPLSPLSGPSTASTGSAGCGQGLVQAVQQPRPCLPPVSHEACAQQPLLMQGSMRTAVSEASSVVLPAVSSISFAGGGISAAEAAGGEVVQRPPALVLADDLQSAAAAEHDALLSEEEADAIVDTFPGLPPPIPSPTEPTIGPERAQRCAYASNPLRAGLDFSDLSPSLSRPHPQAPGAIAGCAAESQGDNARSETVSPPAKQPPLPLEGSQGRCSSSSYLNGGVSDLSLPRARGSIPGASPASAQPLQRHDAPWAFHTHDNTLFCEQQGADAEAQCVWQEASGEEIPVQWPQVNAQKLSDSCDGVPAAADRTVSPDENSCENLQLLPKSVAAPTAVSGGQL